MKKIVISTMIALFAATSHASVFCDNLTKLSGVIMKARQNNISANAMLILLDKEVPDADLNELARELVLMAYSRPRFHSESMQSDAIRDFENNITITCARSRHG